MILILGPQDPYELLNQAMARCASRTEICFAPEDRFLADENKMNETVQSCSKVVEVVLDDKPNKNMRQYVDIAKAMQKPIEIMHFASKSFDRKKGRMRGLTYLRTTKG